MGRGELGFQKPKVSKIQTLLFPGLGPGFLPTTATIMDNLRKALISYNVP